MKRPFLLWPVLSGLVLLTGCSGSTALSPNNALSQEVQDLKARIVDLQRQAAMTEVELARLRQQVAELEGRSGGARTAPPPSRSTEAPRTTQEPARPAPSRPAPSTPPAAAPVQEPRRDPAPSQPVRREPAPAPRPAPAEPIEIEEVDIDLPPAAPAPVAPAAPAPPAASGEPGPEASPSAAQVLYDRGYSLYHQGHYLDAEASFQRFLQASPGGDLADNAQYWIGECRYARGDMKGALTAFREVVERHPKGNKVPDALLKAGQSLEGMGDVEGARVTYREVVRRFPGSAAAAAADERRAKLP